MFAKGGKPFRPRTAPLRLRRAPRRDASRPEGDLGSGADGVSGIGATARATTIINYCGLDVFDVPYVCEVAGSDKIGHYIPGTRIPSWTRRGCSRSSRPRVLLFSWHMADVIVPKLRERGYRARSSCRSRP
jgi:hypothetical protein